MRAVVNKKRSYTGRDILRFFGLIFIHFFFIGAYSAAIMGIHTLFAGQFFDSNPFTVGWWAYAIIVSPIVNAIFHAIYSERGLPWFRVLMFFHYFALVILVPITVFI